MSNNPYIQEVNESTFEEMVIASSHQLPVVVDFWADWCQPCRTLMPLLMKLAEEYNGKFLLAKVNSDQNQQLAAQYGVRSLPTVQVFMDGKPVDSFMGALPESQIREFLDKHIPNEVDLMLDQAKSLIGEGNTEQGVAILEQAATMDPSNVKVKLLQAQYALACEESDKAKEVLESLGPAAQGNEEVTALLNHIKHKDKLTDAPEDEALKQRLEADENDSEARYLLALRYLDKQDFENALEQLLTLLQKDRQFQDGVAQKTMLEVFNLLGGEGELVSKYRNKLFNTLH